MMLRPVAARRSPKLAIANRSTMYAAAARSRMVLSHMAQSTSSDGGVLLRSTVSAIMAVSAAQAKNRYTNRSGQPNRVERANIHSVGGLNRMRPRANSPTSRSLRRASCGMALQLVLVSPQLRGHIACGGELAEAGGAAPLPTNPPPEPGCGGKQRNPPSAGPPREHNAQAP